MSWWTDKAKQTFVYRANQERRRKIPPFLIHVKYIDWLLQQKKRPSLIFLIFFFFFLMQWHRIFHKFQPWPYLLCMHSTSCKECMPLHFLHSAAASCWVMRAGLGQGEGASINTSLGVILVPFFTPGGSPEASRHMSENLICENQQKRKDGV